MALFCGCWTLLVGWDQEQYEYSLPPREKILMRGSNPHQPLCCVHAAEVVLGPVRLNIWLYQGMLKSAVWPPIWLHVTDAQCSLLNHFQNTHARTHTHMHTLTHVTSGPRNPSCECLNPLIHLHVRCQWMWWKGPVCEHDAWRPWMFLNAPH